MTLGARSAGILSERGALVGSGIAGLGAALTERIVANDEITPAIGVDADWIVRRTGIRERRYARRRERRCSSWRRPPAGRRWPTPESPASRSISCSWRVAARTP